MEVFPAFSSPNPNSERVLPLPEHFFGLMECRIRRKKVAEEEKKKKKYTSCGKEKKFTGLEKGSFTMKTTEEQKEIETKYFCGLCIDSMTFERGKYLNYFETTFLLLGHVSWIT